MFANKGIIIAKLQFNRWNLPIFHVFEPEEKRLEKEESDKIHNELQKQIVKSQSDESCNC